MKKIFLSLSIIGILMGLNSCDKDMSNPNASVLNSLTISAPTSGTVLSLNPNLYNSAAMTVKWSSANFGYSASVTYLLQIVKASDSFDSPQIIPLGTFSEYSNLIHESAITTTVLNGKLNATLADVGSVSAFKMRVIAKPSTQLDSSANGLFSYSQEVTFSSNVYDPIDEVPKLYVYGNFGAASAFSDWDINLTGTSNSPLIYSKSKNSVYEGFIYMNVASPQFKFANPSSTDLNIKGVNAPFTATTISGISATSALGSVFGTVQTSTDVATGNVITPPSSPATATGSGTYFVKVDWAQNQYILVKRVIAIKGPTTSNTAKYLTYETNPTSPYYRMYVGTNINLSAGQGYIQLKDNSSALDDKVERLGIDNTSNTLVPNVKNKLKFSGGSNFNVTSPGLYTVVLDLRNSAIYNLRIIPN